MKWVKVKVRNWGVESKPHMHRLIWRVLCNILDIEEIRISQIIHPMDKFSGNFQMKIREAKFFWFKIFVYIKFIVLRNLRLLGQSFEFALIQILIGKRRPFDETNQSSELFFCFAFFCICTECSHYSTFSFFPIRENSVRGNFLL